MLSQSALQSMLTQAKAKGLGETLHIAQVAEDRWQRRHRRDIGVVPTFYEYFMLLLTYWILRDLWLCKTQFCLNSKRYVGGS